MKINQKREGTALLGCARSVDLPNALLSFAYTLLVHNCAAALEALGLDPDVGFLHPDRPGVTSGWWLRTGSWQSFPVCSHHNSGYLLSPAAGGRELKLNLIRPPVIRAKVARRRRAWVETATLVSSWSTWAPSPAAGGRG